MKKLKTPNEYVDLLTKANEAYYNTGETLMTDAEYDALRDEFEKQFPDHEFHKTVGAKTTHTAFVKVKHEIPMGSQAKVNTPDELVDWSEKQQAKVKVKIKYNVSEKVDGFSLSLNYVKGNLVQAVTRGDGEIGEDVTVNVKKMKQVPLKLKSPVNATVRGESVLFIKDFEEFFSDKANPRNAAAGTVRRLDGERCEHLTFLCYNIESPDLQISSESDKFKALTQLGFTTPLYHLVESLDEVVKIWQDYESGKRAQANYEMDGLVVTVDDITSQNILGIIDQRPRFSRAFKFSAQMGETEIDSVEWFVGRTGRITPVAVVKPLKLAGVTISNITLHNLSEINRLGVTLGSKVLIKRAGDVIPKIEKVVKTGKTKIKVPHHCPSCAQATVAEEIFLWCKNATCPAQGCGTLLHWVKSLEIKGFGDELVQQLFDAKLVKEPADFYTLTVAQIAALDRRGEKSATKVLEALHAKKDLTVPEFVKGLGISHISDKLTEVIQAQYPTIDQMMAAKVEELSSIHGIGEKFATNFSEGLKTRRSIIKNLLKHLTLKKRFVVEGGALNGQTFCFTGVRDKNLEKQITALGGKIASGVSKTLTVLVCKDPEENSSKLKKARELGVKILTLAETQNLVKEAV